PDGLALGLSDVDSPVLSDADHELEASPAGTCRARLGEDRQLVGIVVHRNAHPIILPAHTRSSMTPVPCVTALVNSSLVKRPTSSMRWSCTPQPWRSLTRNVRAADTEVGRPGS